MGKEADLFMRLTKLGSAWKLRKWNFKLLLKKLREHLSKKRIRFLGLSLSSLKLDKKLSVVWLRKRKNLPALVRTLVRLPTQCKVLLNKRVEARLKLFV